jgi:hypothetical protein
MKVDVTLARKVGGVLLLVILLGYPAMACLTSAAEMTAAERECCKHMAHQCGSMNMPSSHSCCQTEVRRPPSILQPASTHIAPPIAAEAAVIELANPFVAQTDFLLVQFHSPPESPPGTPSILRI